MKEILFRIKLDYCDKWVYGLPSRIFPNDRCSFEYKEGDHNCYDGSNASNTLSQFTGVFDKNGNKLFDGDIFENSAGYRYLVFFENGCFIAQLISDSPWKTMLHLNEINHLIADECHIIGNKWDNPEILKGGKQ